jgi:hypothetical protein
MRLFALAACIALVACSANSTSDNPPPSPEPNADAPPPPATSGGSTKKGDPLPPPSNDQPPSDRPPPSTSGIRDCGLAKTSPIKITYTSSLPIFRTTMLGSGIVDGRPASQALWATGTPSRISPASTTMSASGPDQSPSEMAGSLGKDLLNTLDIPSTIDDWAKGLAPTATRLTFGSELSRQEVGWSIDEPLHTPETPADGKQQFVRSIEASQLYGVVFILDLPSVCSAGALADAMGRPAKIANGGLDTGLFDPKIRDAAQKVLVRDGATMHVEVISSNSIPGLYDLLDNTSCSTGDLGACLTLLQALLATGPSGAKPSVLDDLQHLRDPNWVPGHYEAADVAILE